MRSERRSRQPLRPFARSWDMSDSFVVACPYCGEEIELYLEPEIRGELIQDCEVCCNPWLIRVRGEDEQREISVARADGSD
jgi:hypothetical protein